MGVSRAAACTFAIMTVATDSILPDDVPWLKLVVSFSVIVYTLHTYLDVRQLRVSS